MLKARKGACGLCRIWKPAKQHFIADFMYFSWDDCYWIYVQACYWLTANREISSFPKIVNDLQAGAHVGRRFGAGLYTEWDWCVVWLQVSVINSYSFCKIMQKIILTHVIKYPVTSPEGKVSNQGKGLIVKNVLYYSRAHISTVNIVLSCLYSSAHCPSEAECVSPLQQVTKIFGELLWPHPIDFSTTIDVFGVHSLLLQKQQSLGFGVWFFSYPSSPVCYYTNISQSLWSSIAVLLFIWACLWQLLLGWGWLVIAYVPVKHDTNKQVILQEVLLNRTR